MSNIIELVNPITDIIIQNQDKLNIAEQEEVFILLKQIKEKDSIITNIPDSKILNRILTSKEIKQLLLYIHTHNHNIYLKEKEKKQNQSSIIVHPTIIIDSKAPKTSKPPKLSTNEYDLFCLRDFLFSSIPNHPITVENLICTLKEKLPSKQHPMFLETINTILIELITKDKTLFQSIKKEMQELKSEMTVSEVEVELYFEKELALLDLYDTAIAFIKEYRNPTFNQSTIEQINHLLFTPFIEKDLKDYFKGNLACYLLNHSLQDIVENNPIRIKTYQKIQQIRNGSIRIIRDRIDTNTYVIIACFVKKVTNSSLYREYITKRLKDYQTIKTEFIDFYKNHQEQAITEGNQEYNKLRKKLQAKGIW